MHHNATWAGVRNILCIRLDSLGDVLMTSPAIRALKQGGPQRRITLLTSPSGAAVAPLIEEIEQTIAYDPPWMKASAPAQDAQTEFQMIERLKRPNFDAAVIFTAFSQSPLPAALMAFMAEIPLRLAYCRENPYQLLTDWAPETDERSDFGMRHEVLRHLDLVAKVGCPAEDRRILLTVPEASRKRAARVLQQSGVDLANPWVLMHPGATAPSRRYSPEKYAAAARQLARDHGLQVVFTGGREEVELVESIRYRMRAGSYSVAGKLALPELSAAIALAPLLITNNTGPVHIAAGVQTPVVDLYALTNPQHTPWMTPNRVLYHDVPCKFCYKSVCPLVHHNCLELVEPEQVVGAALELLADTRQTQPAVRAV